MFEKPSLPPLPTPEEIRGEEGIVFKEGQSQEEISRNKEKLRAKRASIRDAVQRRQDAIEAQKPLNKVKKVIGGVREKLGL